jgi:hypothetical protein
MGEFTPLGKNAHGPASVGVPFFDSFESAVNKVLVQFLERRRTEPNFSLRGKRCFPYLYDHGPRAGDLRCIELSFFILFANSIPLNVTCALTNVLNPGIGQHLCFTFR